MPVTVHLTAAVKSGSSVLYPVPQLTSRLVDTVKKCRITVMKIARYDSLIAQYENPIEHSCSMKIGQTFICDGWNRPDGLCESAWESMSAFVMTLAHGGENLYDGWMKNPRSAMVSCNDGFRPVSFLIEALDEDAAPSA